jgi:hypothetical protein
MSSPKHNRPGAFPVWAALVLGLIGLYAIYLAQTGELRLPESSKQETPQPAPALETSQATSAHEGPERAPSRKRRHSEAEPAEPLPPIDEVMPFGETVQTPSESPVPEMAEPMVPSEVEAIPDATPEPEPTPTPIADLLKDRHLMPSSVRLLQPTVFPVIFDGRAAGEISLPPGSSVAVTDCDGKLVTVRHGEGSISLPIERTDFEERLREKARSVQAASEAVPEVPASSMDELGRPVERPATTPWWMDAKPGADAAAMPADDPGKQLKVEAIVRRRSESSAARGQATESLRLRVRISNSSITTAIDNLKVSVWMFAESAADRHNFRLLGSETLPATIAPRGSVELTTKDFLKNPEGGGGKLVAGAGWAVVIKNKNGEVVTSKASQSGFQNPDRLFALEPDAVFDRKLQPVKGADEE